MHFASIQFSIILNAKKGQKLPFLFKLTATKIKFQSQKLNSRDKRAYELNSASKVYEAAIPNSTDRRIE